jgi:hypothetical protein
LIAYTSVFPSVFQEAYPVIQTAFDCRNGRRLIVPERARDYQVHVLSDSGTLGTVLNPASHMSPHSIEATPVPDLALPEIRKDESAPESVPAVPVADLSHDEPVVTRRELWSYYCVYHYIYLCLLTVSL